MKNFYRHQVAVLTVVAAALILISNGICSAQQNASIVRLAKLQINPSQLKDYEAALKEEIETSIRVEPGVLTLYAVAEKNNPTSITIFEIYASEDAYKAHLESAHFKKYKSTTKEMVKSLELVEVEPVALGAK